MPRDPSVTRAARLSRIPGVSIDEACARFGATRDAVKRARRESGAGLAPSTDDLLLAAMSDNAQRTEGDINAPQLERIAAWIDYVNKDGCTLRDAQRMLQSLCARGVLQLEGTRWRLLQRWPSSE